MSIVEQLTATSQQLQDAGLSREAALAIASAIAAAQEENRERMTAMENAIKEMTATIKVLGERQAETNRRVDALEEAVKALGKMLAETNQKIADAQKETDKKISDLFWRMAFLMAFMQAPVYSALLGRAMGWWQ